MAVLRPVQRQAGHRRRQGREGHPRGQQEPRRIYRSYGTVDKTEIESFFRRSTRLWSQYHDTGTMEIAGGRPSTNAVLMRLTGFNIPIEGFVRLTGHYMEEYGRLVGIDVTCTVERSTANRDPCCEWELRLGRSPETEAYVASLPPVRGG